MVTIETVEPTRFVLSADETQPHAESIAGGAAVVYSAKCPDKSTPNEDGAALIRVDDQRGVLAVADGLGGQPAGDQASAVALAELHRAVEESVGRDGELRDGILNGFERANQAVVALGVGAGTTMAVIEIQQRTIRPYHAGDSMILVVGQRGKIKLQTISHSPVGYAVESGLLEAGEAIDHADRHLISNLLGTPEMRIEIGPILDLAARDTVLLASDGLFDNLHVEEIVERTRKGRLRQVAERMAADCHDRMHGAAPGHPCKPDDFTFIAFRLGTPA